MKRFIRSSWAALAVGAFAASACGSSGSSTASTTTTTTTVAATTTSEAATTTSTTLSPTTSTSTSTTTTTTTTIPQTAAETTLLVQALTNVPGYEYYDYSTAVANHEVDDINAVPSARDVFASMSLHMVVQKQHLISTFELYSLRDNSPATDLATLSQMVLRLHNWVDAGSKSETMTVGTNTAVAQNGNGRLVWMWIDKAVLYTVWDETSEGNAAFTTDFVAAAMSAQQGLPAPAPTIPKQPSTKYLGPEDQSLADRLPAIEDFFYVDPPYDVAVWFYGAFKGSTILERGSFHAVIHGGDVANNSDAEYIGDLMLIELKNALKTNKKAIALLVNSLKQVAAPEDTYAVTEMKIGSTTVWVVSHRDSTGDSLAYVWEFKGVAYVFDTNGECSAACTENLNNYVAKLVVGATNP